MVLFYQNVSAKSSLTSRRLANLGKTSHGDKCNYSLSLRGSLMTNVPIRQKPESLQSKSTDWFQYDGNNGC